MPGRLTGTRASFLEDFDALSPRRLLTVVDLPEVEYLPLNDAPATHALVFNDVPVMVLLAVFDPPIALQEHDGARFYTKNRACEEGRSTLQAILKDAVP